MNQFMFVVAVVGMLAVSCSPMKKSLVGQLESPVTELAIRVVKDGNEEAFKDSRRKFISVLKGQKGVLSDREFQSVYALPEPDRQQVFIGMTDYASYRTVGKVQRKWGVARAFLSFNKTMDLKAYVFVQQTEGPTFNLATLASGPGEILEIGVRRVKPGMQKEFHEYRKKFVELLSSYEGVKESYEFQVVGGKDIDGLTVGMTVYKSQDAFMKLAGPIMQEDITQRYFNTFDIVASQFAFSTSSQ
ncbi:MAG: hypothetical protein H6568_11115 [Lewinellaceae bacterium]|nr:hypothetical protein [Saprospiraceae bacterium]MCB9313306.1 hypothetical protein [Lewinellaceae bacterium]